jgi:hypothetical protein
VVSAALLGACTNEITVGPEERSAIPTDVASLSRVPDLSGCPKLQAPADTKLAYHTFAKGVQIYRWNGTSWGFVAPEALLSADRKGNSVIGTHYAGPTWESNSGSKVVAAVIDRCTPDPNAIAWLSLGAVGTTGHGVFHRVTFIQRVNTDGGLAPSAPGSIIGEEARIPYTTEYYFYRLK